MTKLNFYFLPHDDMLEARFENGFTNIIGVIGYHAFKVSSFHNGECVEIGEYTNIYESLEAANKWAAENGILN